MSDRKAFALLRFLTAFFLAATFSFTVFLAWASAPYIERWALGPVVSTLRIVSIERTQDGHSLVNAEFTKLRECNFNGIAWYHRIGKSFVRVQVELGRVPTDPSISNRPLGLQQAGPWIIHLTPDELKTASFAQLQHDCFGLWTTTTDFYP